MKILLACLILVVSLPAWAESRRGDGLVSTARQAIPVTEEERLFCPVCQEKDLKSTVRDTGSHRYLSLCIPKGKGGYWGEDGVYVPFVPDDPKACPLGYTSYECSHGHTFTREYY